MNSENIICLHPRWENELGKLEFRQELAVNLDDAFDVDSFCQSVHSIEDFCRQLIAHGMVAVVPDSLTVILSTEIADAESRHRLAKLAGDKKGSTVKDFMVASLLAYAQGINEVVYTYCGGTDELHLEESLHFGCVERSLREKSFEIWEKACDNAGIAVDDLFWHLNNDSGAGSGNTYTCSLTVTLPTLMSGEGETEWHEHECDFEDRYSDESPEDY